MAGFEKSIKNCCGPMAELLWPHGRIVVTPWPILRKVLRIVVAPWQNCCGPMADFDKVFRIVVPPWIRVSVRVSFVSLL
jgi:hypothetical protein